MSPTWLRMRKHFEQRIERIHIELENPKRTEEQTQMLRGRIAELRLLLLLNETAPAHPVDDA